MNRKQFRELSNFTNALMHCTKGILDENLSRCLNCVYLYETDCKMLLCQNIDKYFCKDIRQGLKDILEGVEDI